MLGGKYANYLDDLVLKPGGNTRRADEELKLYRDADQSSEMAYRQWAGLHRESGPSMTKLSEEGERRAKSDLVSAWEAQVSLGRCDSDLAV